MKEVYFKMPIKNADGKKIFASVGTHPQAFDRLLKELDRIAPKHSEWEIIAQAGNSKYAPKNFVFKKYFNGKKFNEKIKWADVVLSHGGAGTIISALLHKTPLIVVPRLKKFKEHTNDHQLDLAKVLEREGKAITVFDIKELEQNILKAFSFKPNLSSDKERLIKRISLFLEESK